MIRLFKRLFPKKSIAITIIDIVFIIGLIYIIQLYYQYKKLDMKKVSGIEYHILVDKGNKSTFINLGIKNNRGNTVKVDVQDKNIEIQYFDDSVLVKKRFIKLVDLCKSNIFLLSDNDSKNFRIDITDDLQGLEINKTEVLMKINIFDNVLLSFKL